MSFVGVPIKVLQAAEGHVITCELISGEVYKGKLLDAEDNMNLQLANITVTYRKSKIILKFSKIENWHLWYFSIIV